MPTLLRFVTPRSFLCEQPEGLLGRLLPPWLEHFGPALRSCCPPFPDLFGSGVILPRAFRPLQRSLPIACLPCLPSFPPCGGPPGLRESASLGVFALFATSVGVARTWAPTPPSGFFPGLPRFKPVLSDAPPLAFCTPPTVFSTTDLASLFHPAAAFRVFLSRGFSLTWSRSSFRWPLPSCRSSIKPAVLPTPSRWLSTSRLCSPSECCCLT